ncbi:DUF3800 domain-containing protein [Candidatus Gottesmanbacteria bacterium]|nr:DUF3800 domain-containing protein [Candidatus Gottesmanbacteria bacterium]
MKSILSTRKKILTHSTDPVFGFLDESSTLDRDSKFFCVAIVASNNQIFKNLQKIIKHVRKKNLSELKFNNSDEKTRKRVLTELNGQDVLFLILAVDKQGRKVKNNPLNYGIVVGSAAAQLLELHPTASLTVDRHFTNSIQENEFKETVLKTVTKLAPSSSKLFLNETVDSQTEIGIQMADFVAGAVNACYNNEDISYLEIIRTKIEKETCERWTEIKRRAIKS